MESAARICRKARRQAKLSPGDLASIVGCSSRTVLNIEAGQHEPSYRLVLRIVAACEREVRRSHERD